MKTLTTLESTTLDNVIGGCKLVPVTSNNSPMQNQGSFLQQHGFSGFTSPEPAHGFQAITDRISAFAEAADSNDQPFDSAVVNEAVVSPELNEIDTTDAIAEATADAGLPPFWCGPITGGGVWGDDSDEVAADKVGMQDDLEVLAQDELDLQTLEQDELNLHTIQQDDAPAAYAGLDSNLATAEVIPAAVHEVRDHRAPMEAVINDHRTAPIMNDHRS